MINAGLDKITIKTEICGQGDEPMEDEEDKEVVCIVSLHERNRIISLDDPFQTDENSGGEEESYRTDGEELLDESEDNGEDRDDESRGEDAGVPEPAADAGQQEDGQGGEERLEGNPDGNGEESGEKVDENPVEIESEPVVNVKHPDNMYKAARSVMAGGQDPMKLNLCMKLNRGEDPGFMMGGDERILRNANMCNMEEKRISSASFDPVSGRCYTCSTETTGPGWLGMEAQSVWCCLTSIFLQIFRRTVQGNV
jgi:hypothetical protein